MADTILMAAKEEKGEGFEQKLEAAARNLVALEAAEQKKKKSKRQEEEDKLNSVRDKLAQRIPGLYQGEGAYEDPEDPHGKGAKPPRRPMGLTGNGRPPAPKKSVRVDTTPMEIDFTGISVIQTEALDVIRRKKKIEDDARMQGTDEALCGWDKQKLDKWPQKPDAVPMHERYPVPPDRVAHLPRGPRQ